MSTPERIHERKNLRTVIQKVARALKQEGFSIVAEIRIAQECAEAGTRDQGDCSILLVCNPVLAYKAVSLDSRTGVLLTSRIAFHERDDGNVSVSTFNPLECMEENIATSPLEDVFVEVAHHLRRAIDRLQSRESY